MALGSRVGTAIADHLVRAMMATKAQTAPLHVDVAMAIQESFFGLTGRESAANFGPLLRKLIATGELDPDTARLLGFVARGQGQLATMLGNTIAGTAVGAGLGTLLTNFLQPAIGPLMASNPSMPLAVSDAVRAQVTQLGGGLDLAYEVAKQGIEGRKFDVLVDLAKARPAPAEVLDLINRSHVNVDYARTMLHRLGFDPTDTELMLELRTPLLSPQELATLTNFGVFTESQAWDLAQRTGIPRDEFHALVLGDGQPPSLQELLFAYRRGFITKERLFHGVQQGPLRTEWFDVVESFGQVPMSTEEAIGAAVQGHMSVTKAREIALQNGLIPDQFQPLLDTHGEAPGVVQMLELKNRGFMTEAEVVAGIKESRLKDKYIPMMLKFAIKIPPERSVVSLLSKGAIDAATALDMLLQLGYTVEIAAALVAEAHHTKTAKLRDLTEAQIVALYRNRALTRAQTHDMLIPLGYDANEADLILDLADAQWATTHINAGITRVQRSFLSGHIDDTMASRSLDGIGIPAAQRDDLIALWDVERGTVTKALTVAQMTQAMKKGLMTPEMVFPRLVGDGYSSFDSQIIINLAGFTEFVAP